MTGWTKGQADEGQTVSILALGGHSIMKTVWSQGQVTWIEHHLGSKPPMDYGEVHGQRPVLESDRWSRWRQMLASDAKMQLWRGGETDRQTDNLTQASLHGPHHGFSLWVDTQLFSPHGKGTTPETKIQRRTADFNHVQSREFQKDLSQQMHRGTRSS